MAGTVPVTSVGTLVEVGVAVGVAVGVTSGVAVGVAVGVGVATASTVNARVAGRRVDVARRVPGARTENVYAPSAVVV